MHYYIQGMRSVRYDKTGITHPQPVAIDFVDVLSRHLNAPVQVEWQHLFDQENQPLVLVFEATRESATTITNELWPYGLIVKLHWAENC